MPDSSRKFWHVGYFLQQDVGQLELLKIHIYLTTVQIKRLQISTISC